MLLNRVRDSLEVFIEAWDATRAYSGDIAIDEVREEREYQ
jgi:hypothetical protein